MTPAKHGISVRRSLRSIDIARVTPQLVGVGGLAGVCRVPTPQREGGLGNKLSCSCLALRGCTKTELRLPM